MISLIAFILKLLFAAIMGGALVYNPGKIRDESQILYAALVSIMAVTLVSLGRFYVDSAQAIVTGAGIFTVITAVIYMTKDIDFDTRLLYIFSGIIGIICGTGHIFYAIVFTIIVYILLHQGHKFLQGGIQDTVQDDLVETEVTELKN